MYLNPPKAPKLTLALMRRVIREASEGETSANQIRTTLQLSVHRSQVRALLNGDTNLQYTTFICAPVLTPIHMQQSLDWVKEHVTWCDNTHTRAHVHTQYTSQGRPPTAAQGR